jgi:cell division septation protein DedD/nucleoid DNA-binding protein
MTTVQNHIKELLFEQDCVVIPDFGGFVTNFDCAKINSTGRYIAPPQKWLAFNALLKNDDGLLSNYIAKQENISLSQANLKVKTFVEDARRYLRFDKTYLIDGLGSFSQNDEERIQFQPKSTNNFYSESFGMENIFLKKSEPFQNELQVLLQSKTVSNTTIQQVFAAENREPMAEVLEDDEAYSYQKGRFSKVLPYVYGIAGSILLFSVIYFLDTQKSNLSSLNPFQSQSVVQPVSRPLLKVETPVVTTKFENENESTPIVETKIEPVVEVKSTTTETNKRFFIITGSFGSKQNAKKLLSTLKNKGFENAEIIYPRRNEKLIKVSAGGFRNESEADQEAIKVAETMNQATWIYKK